MSMRLREQIIEAMTGNAVYSEDKASACVSLVIVIFYLMVR